jgi:trans-L-3-hydroxyproline dehydratase
LQVVPETFQQRWRLLLDKMVLGLPIAAQSIKCVDMHTTGEPTRIVYQGYPDLKGRLLEQRTHAQNHHDHVRKSLILEPRGHREMYGAILRHETELTSSGVAHIGVLFMTNEGYSTMCGHATIALGRFLVDVQDVKIFPRRKELKFDPTTLTTQLNLHAPCGLVQVSVPTLDDGLRADHSRPVSFLCVPSFAVGIDIDISIPPSHQWPELQGRKTIKADLSYGGAFYCMVSSHELGFPQCVQASTDLPALNNATRLLKETINATPVLKASIKHPDHDELSFLYSVIVVDDSDGVDGSETGVCFFGDQQIDRSATGSGVAARVALAHAKGERELGQKWVYHSLVSRAAKEGGFSGEGIEKLKLPNKSGEDIEAVIVRVSGSAFYTGFHTFVIEHDDPLKDGFLLERLN